MCARVASVRPLVLSPSLQIKAKKGKTSVIIQSSFESATFISNSNVFSHVQSDAINHCLDTGKLVNAIYSICLQTKKTTATLIYIKNQAG